MSELEKGDKVRILTGDSAGREGIVSALYVGHGVPSVCVNLDGGGWRELFQSRVEYIGPDKYEYSVQFFWIDEDAYEDDSDMDWMSREHAERWLKTHDKRNTERVAEGRDIVCRGRLVRRRKAGPVEEV